MADVNYGFDLACTGDIDATGRTVSGPRLVAEAVYRRWTTRRGGLLSDKNYGYDVQEILNDDVSPTDLARHNANLSAEALKDERVKSCEVTSSFIHDVLTIGAMIDIGSGPFQLVLAVTQVTVQILKSPS